MERNTDSRTYAEVLLKNYFKTFPYPFTHHQLNSFDQFVGNDIPAIIKAANPILLLQQRIGTSDEFSYKVEIFIGGLEGTKFYIGTPSLSLKEGEEVRVLYPNEARLRNLTYASSVEADITIKVTFVRPNASGKLEKQIILLDSQDPKYSYLSHIPLFQLPIMLHSRYCLLNDKPNIFLKEVGECPYDYGGYFIVDGSEKILITRQEQAFNTLYATKQQNDNKVDVYASIQCLNQNTKQVKRIALVYLKNTNTLEVSIPFVRKPIPVFILFRALGVQNDEDIYRLIFPNADDIETKVLGPLLHESMVDAHPFTDTYMAIQYIKTLTKGFSESHVYNILYNQTFIHVENKPLNKAVFLADCVRTILRVQSGYSPSTDRDDIRNQRCLTSGLLVRMLYQNVYTKWTKEVSRAIDKEYKYNTTIYEGQNFLNLFLPGNINTLFQVGFITAGINRGFKGKWSSGVGEEKSGVLQPLSRLSYLDFLSHCRRVVLDFDTGMKLQGPRRLHTTQFGYFCTSETPGGSSIGITKNLSILTAISLSMTPEPFINWLIKMGIIQINDLTPLMMKVAVPVYVNAGIVGFCLKPLKLVEASKSLKHTGCLPAYSSVSFNISERKVSFFFDEGRPVRPLVVIHNGNYPYENILKKESWRNMVMGTFSKTKDFNINNTIFFDPLIDNETPTFDDYIKLLKPYEGIIEYIDPYESNESYISMYPELIKKESTHVELHPSTMLGLLTSMIPFPNHNQSPRNQLSCSQSKQGISIYSTNYPNRYDNQTHILCYGEAPLVRTLYYDYVGDGQIGYGHNLILAMGIFSGYNQEDGIVFNADSIERGMFRNITFRSYEAFEEDDEKAHTKVRVANPINMPAWTSLKPGLDYRKLDERGIIKVGEYVDENTVLVGRYIQSGSGSFNDASVTAQVWTTGTVQDISVTINNKGLALVKIRVLQDRIPELGDKFCLTDDHDVLTKNRGWVSINKITKDDKVAQLNTDSNTMEYVNPNETFIFNCDNEELYEVESQGVSLKTTLNHRMWVKERHSDKYNLTEASKIIGKHVRYQSDAQINNLENDIIIDNYIFNKGDKANAWLNFFGIWIAEGWTYIKEEQYINRVEFATNKTRVYNKLKESCEILNWNYSYNDKSSKFYVNEKNIALYLNIFNVGAINKYLPKWVFNLSVEQSIELLNGLCLEDDYEPNTSLQYVTSSRQLKDDIQQLVQHCGYTSYSTIRYEKDLISSILNKPNADAWIIGIRKSRLRPTINDEHSKNQNGQKEIIEKYSGKVYCISVPSEVFLVRRNGRIIFTGNSNRHGQKGTIGMLIRAVDMPRSANGIVPDMMMNPHAIPSRMTIAQLLEGILGKSACLAGFIGDATAFMNEADSEEKIGNVLTHQFGLQRHGEEILYDGTTGSMIPSTIFMGNVYTMRLKHMVEDKWNARGLGRKEQKTHQPTGGRGNQGGLRIGEMERDALLGHGIAAFTQESYMKRSDGTIMNICNGCGTVPITNESTNLYICSLCDGPVQFVGDNINNFEILPTLKRSITTFSKIEIPYSLEVLNKELNTYMNIFLRFLTAKDVSHIRKIRNGGLSEKEIKELLATELQPRIFKDTNNPEIKEETPEIVVSEEQNIQLGNEIVEEIDEPLPQIEITNQEAKLAIDKLTELDDISVVPSIVSTPAQPMVMVMPLSTAMSMNTTAPQATIIQSQVPQAPQTLVIDTSEQAMRAQGFPTVRDEVKLRPILKRDTSPGPSRIAASKKTTFTINKMENNEGSNEDDNYSSKGDVKFNIIKEE